MSCLHLTLCLKISFSGGIVKATMPFCSPVKKVIKLAYHFKPVLCMAVKVAFRLALEILKCNVTQIGGRSFRF